MSLLIFYSDICCIPLGSETSFPVGNIVPLKSEVVFPSGKLGILRAPWLPTRKYKCPSPMERSNIHVVMKKYGS